MAIGTVNQMVKDRLPYLSDVANDPLIERKRIEVVYIMQNQSGKDDASVELEASYKAVENIVFAAMIAWYLLQNKIMTTMAGTGAAGSVGGAKILSKAKADVTEADFILVKAEDGAMIQMKTTDYLDLIKNDVCSLTRVVGWINPICRAVIDIIPAFIMGADFPSNCESDFNWPDGVVPQI